MNSRKPTKHFSSILLTVIAAIATICVLPYLMRQLPDLPNKDSLPTHLWVIGAVISLIVLLTLWQVRQQAQDLQRLLIE